jgi:hypothetical protein
MRVDIKDSEKAPSSLEDLKLRLSAASTDRVLYRNVYEWVDFFAEKLGFKISELTRSDLLTEMGVLDPNCTRFSCYEGWNDVRQSGTLFTIVLRMDHPDQRWIINVDWENNTASSNFSFRP